MTLQTFSRLESKVRGYIRSFPVLFTKAKGAELWDDDGKRYIDFFSGAGTLNYGHNNPLFKEAILRHLEADGVVHGLDMATSTKKTFLETFERLILRPRKMNYKLQFPGPTGTNAVEAALKIARQVKGRANIISFTNGFHGVTGGSLAATGNSKFRDASGIALGNVSFMPYDGYLGKDVDTIEYIERMLSDKSSGVDRPAAAIVETVQGEGGINVASTRWLQALERLCRANDMLLIIDDIQAGCGRTGTFFSFEPTGIKPDIVTLSKSLSGFGLPMALVLIAPEYDIWAPSAHNGTFRGNNLAFATATEALERYWTDNAFCLDIHKKESLIREHLEHIASAYPRGRFSVRGRGMMQGLVSEDKSLAGKISAKVFPKGVILETSGGSDEVLKFLPSLTISDELLLEGLGAVESTVAEILGQPEVRARKVRLAWFKGGRQA